MASQTLHYWHLNKDDTFLGNDMVSPNQPVTTFGQAFGFILDQIKNDPKSQNHFKLDQSQPMDTLFNLQIKVDGGKRRTINPSSILSEYGGMTNPKCIFIFQRKKQLQDHDWSVEESRKSLEASSEYFEREMNRKVKDGLDKLAH